LRYQKTLPKKTEEEKKQEDANFKPAPLKVYYVPVTFLPNLSFHLGRSFQ
jgi:hypothetical protein